MSALIWTSLLKELLAPIRIEPPLAEKKPLALIPTNPSKLILYAPKNSHPVEQDISPLMWKRLLNHSRRVTIPRLPGINLKNASTHSINSFPRDFKSFRFVVSSRLEIVLGRVSSLGFIIHLAGCIMQCWVTLMINSYHKQILPFLRKILQAHILFFRTLSQILIEAR